MAFMRESCSAIDPDAPIAMGAALAEGDAAFMVPGFAQAPKTAATDKAARVRKVVMVNSSRVGLTASRPDAWRLM
jgi:hypothetical protein